ncbi:hypothetical protein WJX72_000621 [[Myrmecia] bisecta]|uniref:alpha-1,2-Mannosidase n=1 Tax=[Myrmecia] bisecta TaxID=41462 RepID=A0AAW1Q6X9_9CHLO
MFGKPNLPVMLLLFLVLGGYAFFLQHKLSSEEPRRGFVTSQEQPNELGTQFARAQVVESASEEEVQLIKRTEELAKQVGALAHALENRKMKLQLPHTVQAAAVHDQPQQASSQQQLQQQAEQLQQQTAMVTPAAVAVAGQEQDAIASKPVLGLNGPVSEAEWGRRRQDVKAAMKHAWDAYVTYAWGFDELMPLTRRGKNSFGGLGATVLDALDTLWLMDLKDDFRRARDWVANDLNFDKMFDASVFETTIRVVGGMLSAFEFSGDNMFVKRAQELCDRLLHAFDTPTGIPFNILNLHTLVAKNPTWTMRSSTLSEFGTEQLEFIKLSEKSGNPVYADKTINVIKYLYNNHADKGMLPLFLNPEDGQFTTTHKSLGAMGDSYYEYLLKTWIMTGKKDDMYRAMWEKSMDEVLETVVFTSSGGFKYIADLDRGLVHHKMDHLACFAPAMFALGVHHRAVTGTKAEQYMELAKDLTYTCWQMYARQPTGLSPEFVTFENGAEMDSGANHNLQRPETLEALFVLWRTTGDSKYREWGWEIFQSIEKWCRVEDGYVGLKDVRQVPPQQDDTQQSFFLAESLKYLYLLFGPNDIISLDEWVLNTEAHPLRILSGSQTTRRK